MNKSATAELASPMRNGDAYYIQKTVSIGLPFVMGMLSILPIMMSYDVFGGNAAILCFVATLLLLSVLYRMLSNPVAVIYDYGLSLPRCKEDILWHDIEKLVIETADKKDSLNIYLTRNVNGFSSQPIAIHLMQRREEFIARLNEGLERGRSLPYVRPASNHSLIMRHITRHVAVPPNPFEGITFSAQGICESTRDQLIPWKNVVWVQARMPNLTIAGNLSCTLCVVEAQGRLHRIDLGGFPAQEYSDLLIYIMTNATEACIDEALIHEINRTPLESYVEYAAVTSVVLALVILFAAFICNDLASLHLVHYDLFWILFALGTACFIGALGLYALPRSWKRLAHLVALSSGALSTAALITFFLISPASYNLISGMTQKTLGNNAAALAQFDRAFEKVPGNIDTHFEIAKLYLKIEVWGLAYEHLVSAYEPEPSYWTAEMYVTIPQTLARMQRYDEALTWCDRLIAESTLPEAGKAEVMQYRTDLIQLLQGGAS